MPQDARQSQSIWLTGLAMSLTFSLQSHSKLFLQQQMDGSGPECNWDTAQGYDMLSRKGTEGCHVPCVRLRGSWDIQSLKFCFSLLSISCRDETQSRAASKCPEGFPQAQVHLCTPSERVPGAIPSSAVGKILHDSIGSLRIYIPTQAYQIFRSTYAKYDNITLRYC